MDVESSVTVSAEEKAAISQLEFAGSLLPWEQFTTSANLFPGCFAIPPWGTKGDFFLTFSLYDSGVKLGEVHTESCNQDGTISIDFDEFLRNFPTQGNGIILAQYNHASEIPVELYLSHIHKPTGTYFAYPAAGYIGDKLYSQGHQDQLENTMFWPGLVSDSNMTASLMVVNPYKVSFSYQITLFAPDGQKVQTEVLKLKPRRSTEHRVEDLFPQTKDIEISDQEKYSLCVAAQYKVVSYHVIRHNESKAITALDHLHPYCLE